MSALERALGRARRLRPTGLPWTAPDWPVSVPRPAPERHLGVDYDSEWSRRYGARLVRAMVLDNLTRPVIHAVASPEVRGAEVLELVEAPAIYVANHASHVDTPLLLSLLPPPRAAPHRGGGGRRPLLRPALEGPSVGAAAQRRPHRAPPRQPALGESAAELVRQGWNLVIYPEGGRTHDGWFQAMRGGAAYLATRTGRPVVPVHIDGTYRILPRGGERLRRSPTRVTFGSPLVAMEGESARRLEATDRRRPGDAGRRGPHRLVVGPPAGGERRHPLGPGSGGGAVAPGLGSRPCPRRGRRRRAGTLGPGRRLSTAARHRTRPPDQVTGPHRGEMGRMTQCVSGPP